MAKKKWSLRGAKIPAGTKTYTFNVGETPHNPSPREGFRGMLYTLRLNADKSAVDSSRCVGYIDAEGEKLVIAALGFAVLDLSRSGQLPTNDALELVVKSPDGIIAASCALNDQYYTR